MTLQLVQFLLTAGTMFDAKYAAAHGYLIELHATAEDAPMSKVFVLGSKQADEEAEHARDDESDEYPPLCLRTYVPTAETVARRAQTPVNIIAVAALSVRRVGKTRDTGLSSAAQTVFDIIG